MSVSLSHCLTSTKPIARLRVVVCLPGPVRRPAQRRRGREGRRSCSGGEAKPPGRGVKGVHPSLSLKGCAAVVFFRRSTSPPHLSRTTPPGPSSPCVGALVVVGPVDAPPLFLFFFSCFPDVARKSPTPSGYGGLCRGVTRWCSKRVCARASDEDPRVEMDNVGRRDGETVGRPSAPLGKRGGWTAEWDRGIAHGARANARRFASFPGPEQGAAMDAVLDRWDRWTAGRICADVCPGRVSRLRYSSTERAQVFQRRANVFRGQRSRRGPWA